MYNKLTLQYNASLTAHIENATVVAFLKSNSSLLKAKTIKIKHNIYTDKTL